MKVLKLTLSKKYTSKYFKKVYDKSNEISPKD